MGMKTFIILVVLSWLPMTIHSAVEDEYAVYVPERNPSVAAKLRQWQSLKFGLLMHWGIYSQWGVVESWTLSPEEYDWCVRREGKNPNDYFLYKKEYEALKNRFDPRAFDPEKWARAAREAGMKYLVFTTKHHDGFCMFDSKYTDYKVTAPDCPFSSHPRRDVTWELFTAFRREGLWTGAYFSKPDWHCPDYWDPKYPPRDRNVNYEPEANPEQWERFIRFTHNQVMELLTDYGPIDILWLDGGWVARRTREEILDWYQRNLEQTSNGYLTRRMISQDIRMDELVQKAREIQPDLIVVDRAVPGKNQNYLTPENKVPPEALPYPWESCIISGGGWSHTRDARYMSGREGVQLLVDIVAKGGNLLLNIAPTPEGKWQPGAYRLLEEYGSWLHVNGEGIYGSEALAPYKEGRICMTRKGGNAYFFYLCGENETELPGEIAVASHRPAPGASVTLLGHRGRLRWQACEKGFKVFLPESVRRKPPCRYVWTFRVSAVQ